MFNGVAQNLIGQGIPAVVAMQYLVGVDAASAFAEDFYLSLGQKESLAIALGNGQTAMGIEGDQWYRPVLYLRWEDNDGGQLFKDSPLPSDSTIQRSPTPPVISPKNQRAQTMTLTLDNEQRKKLRDALMSAFLNKAELKRMLDDNLGIPLNTIADSGNYTDIVYNLLKWANSQGWLQDLVQAAYTTNSGNLELKEFIKEINYQIPNENKDPLGQQLDILQGRLSVLSSHQSWSRVQAIKLKELNKRLEIRESDFEAVSNQLNYTENAQTRNNLQRQLEAIEQDMKKVEEQINELEHDRK
ncbi:effector-associated domain EAD1-containing protein [Scytonema sp. NUACC26]|uniref:effector-associated domain EAD1-containing protein n=1 Tax=Scytonema sp. NUACC26 TaxID=3140176 RepID=UPI0034DC5379